MKYSYIIGGLSRVCLLIVLLVLAGISMWITILNQQAAEREELSASKSALYREGLYDIAIEESAQFEYALRPSRALDNEHQKDAESFLTLLNRLEQDGHPDDQIFATHVFNEQKAYLLASDRYFDAIDIHDLALARVIHYQEIDPVFDNIQDEMIALAKGAQAQVRLDQAQFIHVQRLTFIVTPLIFAIGLLLMIIL